jgi:3-deoxy-D-manno-octulosonic-acid transferase
MYRFLNFVLWPLWFVYTLRVAWREKSWRYFKQRLGYGYPLFRQSPVWIHCASVGEVNTWLPLHELLTQRYPDLNFVITTNTPTGAAIVARQNLKNTQHLFLPVDTRAAMRRFFAFVNPRLVIILETELWLELYRQCHERAIPLTIVNARLSNKTLNTSAWLKQQYAAALQCVDKILCRSEADVEAYRALGAAADKIKMIGNLKFAARDVSVKTSLENFTTRPYVLAASTHDDEELQLARIWQGLNIHDQLLVIVPRHPQRRDAILQQLSSLNLNIAVRSRGDAIMAETQIYLADTIGELVAFMRDAKIVFMGGSLVPRGGQNLLEPARLGKAIVLGPHMYNFQAETELFLQQQAAVRVENAEALSGELQQLVQNESRRSELGEHARRLMMQQADMAQRYLTTLIEHYDQVLSS